MRNIVGALLASTALALAAAPAWAQLPALRDRPLGAAERVRYASLEAQFTRISTQRNTSVAAVRTIARALGERLATQDPDQIVRAIDERVQELSAARGRIAALERDLEAMDSMRLAQAVGPLLTAAGAAIDSGDLVLAEGKLAEAGQRFADARGNLQGRVEQLSLREADILAQRAAVRASTFDYLGAAALYAQAAALVPASDEALRWRYLVRQGESLRDEARWRGDLESLRRALVVYRDQALPLAPRATRSADWSTTQERLGVAMADLASRTEDPAGSRQALDVLRAASEATDRAAQPREWARRRTELAIRLGQSSERAPDLASLPEAVAMLEEVEAQRNLEPGFHRNYGAIVALMGLRQHQLSRTAEGTATLGRAVEILRRGVTTTDSAGDPREFAMLQQNIAFTLKLLSDARPDAALMRQSIAAAEEGLRAVSREQSPLLWAGLQRRVGYGLMELSQMSTPPDRGTLDQGLSRLHAALEVVTRDRSPADWAALQIDLSTALRTPGMLESGPEALEPALLAARASGEVFTRQARPRSWANAQGDMGVILAEQARRSEGPARVARLAQARAAFAEGRETFQAIGDAVSVARIDRLVGELDALPAAPSATASPPS